MDNKQPGSLSVTIDLVPYPAYMVNFNFEVTWSNDESKQLIAASSAPAKKMGCKSIIQHLLESELHKNTKNFIEVLRFHLALAKSWLTKERFDALVKDLPEDAKEMLENLYLEVEIIPPQPIVEHTISLFTEEGKELKYNIYASYFREGILFIFFPRNSSRDGLLDILASRDDVILKLLRKRLPAFTPLAAMAVNLQESAKICADLPPNEYFELINQIWATMSPIFRKYHGINGKQVGDNLLYYFFPQSGANYIINALHCTQEIRRAIKKISKEWQIRKGWMTELYLNIGLNEGQEWLGTFQTPANVEFTVLGVTVNQAAYLSEVGRYGEIWATKNFISQLNAEERKQVQFGVDMNNTIEGRSVFVPFTYTQLSGLANISNELREKIWEFRNLPIAKILEICEV